MYDTINLEYIKDQDQIFGGEHDVEARANELGITLTKNHWEAIKFIRTFYQYHEGDDITAKDLSKGLAGKFAEEGGLKYLFRLFPDGPVKSGGYIAGIPSLKHEQDQSFGTTL